MTKSKEEFLREYISKYINLLPEFLRSDDNFLVFFALLCHEFNITERNIQNFTDLVNPDKVPKQFLEYLGFFMNYHYQDRASEDFNRELLMRNRKLYEDRGTEHSIIMAASHGANEGYLGGDIFIPGYSISTDIAELSVARDKIFIHSKSKFSSTSVYADGDSFRPGIIVLSMPYLDNAVRAKLWEVIPAGIRLRYNIVSNFVPNEPDPDDIYNFEPPWGVPKDEYGNLTYYPYFRVVPIPSKGDPHDPEDPTQNPIDFTYIIDMAIDPLEDILVFSDGTRNAYKYFNKNGIYVPEDYNPDGSPIYKVPLKHGQRLHSGRKTLMEDNAPEFSLGVSALPLSLVRRPFDLSSFPAVKSKTDIIIPTTPTTPEDVSNTSTDTEELYPFEHSGKAENSNFSSNALVSGEVREKETAPEQSYDNETHKEDIKDTDYLLYRITPTGEYEDRIDKLTADSVTRNLTVSMSIDHKIQKYHRVRHRSMRSGRFSGSQSIGYELEDNSTFEPLVYILRTLLIDGADFTYSTESGLLIPCHVDPLNSKLSTSMSTDFETLISLIQDVAPKKYEYNKAQATVVEKQEYYASLRSSSSEKKVAYQQLVEARNERNQKSALLNSAENAVQEQIDTILSSSSLGNYVSECKSILDYYTNNNYLFGGIYDVGHMFEYVPIMTMQPSDCIYPISQVLDMRPIEGKPGYLDVWDGTPETEKLYGLRPKGENRSPFYQPKDDERIYMPVTARKSKDIYGQDIIIRDNMVLASNSIVGGDWEVESQVS